MKNVIFSFLLASVTLTVFAQGSKDQLCKIWYNEERDSRVEVRQLPNGTFQAIILWIKEPNENGKPKVDKHNPNDKLKSQPVLGMNILSFLHKSKDDPNFYEGGKIYDPKNGKTYDCRMTFKGNTIQLRGYVLGMPFLGRNSTWWLAEGQ